MVVEGLWDSMQPLRDAEGRVIEYDPPVTRAQVLTREPERPPCSRAKAQQHIRAALAALTKETDGPQNTH